MVPRASDVSDDRQPGVTHRRQGGRANRDRPEAGRQLIGWVTPLSRSEGSETVYRAEEAPELFPADGGTRPNLVRRNAARARSAFFIVPLNLARVVLAWIWTICLGTPLVAFIYARYWYGLLRAELGRPDILDRALEANAYLAGWIAQHLWTSFLFMLINVPLRVRELVPVDWSQTHVICSNHTSLLDILALVRVVPPPFRFVAKRELTHWPIVGWALRPAGQVIIDRSDREQAIQSIAEAAARSIRGQVIFFVEGTRSRTGQLQPFKKGAFHFAVRNQLPVLPVAIRGSYSALAKLPWWRLRSGVEIEIRFCAPIQLTAISSAAGIDTQVEILRSDTRVAIAGALEASD